MQHIKLPDDYSLVLQEVGMSGEEDVAQLAESLNFDQGRLQHILHALQHKGLVCFVTTNGRGMWVRLSAKGSKLMRTIWPEAGLTYSF